MLLRCYPAKHMVSSAPYALRCYPAKHMMSSNYHDPRDGIMIYDLTCRLWQLSRPGKALCRLCSRQANAISEGEVVK
jgi:hypothetical protein